MPEKLNKASENPPVPKSPEAVTPPNVPAKPVKSESAVKSGSSKVSTSNGSKGKTKPRSKRSVRKAPKPEEKKSKPKVETQVTTAGSDKRNTETIGDNQTRDTINEKPPASLSARTPSNVPSSGTDQDAVMKILTAPVVGPRPNPVFTADAETPTVFEKIAAPRPVISPLEKYKPSGIVPDKPSIEEKTKDSEPKTAIAVLCKDDTPTAYGGPPKDPPPDDDKPVTSCYMPIFPSYAPPS
ncbi:hypothetical protein M3Y94_00575400 [Aphelenchoides besseyi]|nr:hypothetical protein M3Y94_00575400 [Aphelenchoides besseyi]KAI6218052.1 hypothetical protein M3Y95_01179300 [Aphelenchoides besseyi]